MIHFSWKQKVGRSAVMAAIVLGCSVSTAWAQKKAPGTDSILQARDGFPIHITYFESAQGKESPVAILIPAAEGSDAKDARTRRVWEKTALELQKSGYAVVSVDLRKHGDSQLATEASSAASRLLPADYAAMAALDLEAVKDFLMEEHANQKLNIRKTGIVAAGSSCMVATAFAIDDWAKKPYPDAPTIDQRTPRGQDIRALMMISPKASVKGLNTTAAMRAIKGIPVGIYVLASSKDRAELRDADKIFTSVELKGDEYADVRKIVRAPIAQSAEQFVEGKEADTTNKEILGFFNKNLKDLPEPWQSRKSRL